MRVRHLIGILLVGALSVGLGVHYVFNIALPNFGVVHEGVLYRSGQPRGAGLPWLRARGIHTLVNLRTAGSDGIFEERLFARENGLRYFNIPIGHTQEKMQQAVDQFLEIVDDETNWPILVHCSRGKERAGLMSAVFRIHYDGWSNRDALEEAYLRGLIRDEMPTAELFISEYQNGMHPKHGVAEIPEQKEVSWLD